MTEKISSKQWAAIKVLEQKESAKSITTIPLTATNREDIKGWVSDFMEEAKKLKLPSKYWQLPSHSLSYRKNCRALMTFFMGKPLALPILEEILEQGGSIWPLAASQDDLGGMKLQTPVIHMWDAYSLINHSLSVQSIPLKEFNLKAALKEGDELRPSDFITELCNYYKESVEGSSKTSVGVLGKKDKVALDNAKLILKQEDALVREAKLLGLGVVRKVSAMLKDAKERVSLKSQAPDDSVNPEKIKKALTAPQKDRLKVLYYLISNHPADVEMVSAAFELTPWLAKTPSIASITLPGAKSNLIEAAISKNSVIALEIMEKMGANIWLAAAQAECKNAVEWFFENKRWHRETLAGDPESPVAKMLLKGAWLSGVSDP